MRLTIETESQNPVENSIEELSLHRIIKRLRSMFIAFPDKRTGQNLTYKMEDIALGAVLFFSHKALIFWIFNLPCKKNRA